MSLQIFILGMLCEGEHHPYDMKKMLLKPLENAISINDGTLYYNFEVLHKKGYIEKKQVVQSENRPERTTYGITDKGREALENEIYSAFQNVTSVLSLYSSLMFLDKVNPHKLAFILEEVIAKRERNLEQVELANLGLPGVPENKKEAVRLVVDHAGQALKQDVEWLKKLLVYVRGLQ
ncbi:PadR family transcriptional regulator [Gorillibacterium massiliense]|uniref:PadR family transcriptional regulator n=1 Tax=Gorillibacterium massiliense TaxID=1280390 RepID=UPI0004B7D5A2|nr:PadR family transcriptional regulator [Gorillibacterium massiliense]